MRKMCTIILLTTSVWTSVWGWKIVDLVSLVCNIDQRVDQNVLRNMLFQFEMIDYGIPKCTHTHSKKNLVVASSLIFLSSSEFIALGFLLINVSNQQRWFIFEPPLLVRNVNLKKMNAMNLEDDLHKFEDRRNLKE